MGRLRGGRVVEVDEKGNIVSVREPTAEDIIEELLSRLEEELELELEIDLRKGKAVGKLKRKR
jgi:hypothetical protein